MKKSILLASILAFTAIGTAHASSDPTNEWGGTSTPDVPGHSVSVGSSQWIPFSPHKAGNAGIGTSVFPVVGASVKVDLKGMVASGKMHVANDDGTTVYQTSGQKDVKNHSRLGNFNFVQVGDGDVWFGEWSYHDSTKGNTTHQVYYVGNPAGATVPTSGTATYTVKGINRFEGNNLLSGTFNVDFGAGKVTGSIKNKQYQVVLGSNVSFNQGSRKFSGDAQVKQGRRPLGTGSAEGMFYGANASALAGLAQFPGNHQYDTSFGGTKN